MSEMCDLCPKNNPAVAYAHCWVCDRLICYGHSISVSFGKGNLHCLRVCRVCALSVNYTGWREIIKRFEQILVEGILEARLRQVKKGGLINPIER